MKIALMLISLLFAQKIWSATCNDVTMPDSINIKSKDLVLNGMGTRKATWLKVKVYVGGLYLSKKATDANDILSQPYPKYLRMHFVRDVDGKKLKEGWIEGFEAAVEFNTRNMIQTQIDQFVGMMEDVNKNDEIVLTFTDKGVEVDIKNKQKGTIAGEKFSHALLSVWFVKARDEGLRDGLQGVEKCH